MLVARGSDDQEDALASRRGRQTRLELLRRQGRTEPREISDAYVLIAAVVIAAAAMFVVAFLPRVSALPTSDTTGDLVGILLQAHAGFAALAFVIVVLLLETLQRSEYSELIWDDFIRLSGIRPLAAITFLSIAIEAILILVMSKKPPGSPLPTAEGASNLIAFVYLGLLSTVGLSLWLFLRAFAMLRPSFASELVSASAKRRISESVRDEVNRKLALNLFATWRADRKISTIPPAGAGSSEIRSQVSGRLTDICLGRLDEFVGKNLIVCIPVGPGESIIANRTALGWIASTDTKIAAAYRSCFRIEA